MHSRSALMVKDAGSWCSMLLKRMIGGFPSSSGFGISMRCSVVLRARELMSLEHFVGCTTTQTVFANVYCAVMRYSINLLTSRDMLVMRW